MVVHAKIAETRVVLLTRPFIVDDRRLAAAVVYELAAARRLGHLASSLRPASGAVSLQWHYGNNSSCSGEGADRLRVGRHVRQSSVGQSPHLLLAVALLQVGQVRTSGKYGVLGQRSASAECPRMLGTMA